MLGGGRWVVMDETAMPDTPPILIVEGEAQTARGRINEMPRRFYSMAWGEGGAVLGLEPGRYFVQTHAPVKYFTERRGCHIRGARSSARHWRSRRRSVSMTAVPVLGVSPFPHKVPWGRFRPRRW